MENRTATPSRLTQRHQREIDTLLAEQLPGWEEALSSDAKLKGEVEDVRTRIENAIRDDDEIRYEEKLAEYTEKWEQVNTLAAEAYRAKNSDPELWELRYIKWMKILFIKFETPMGEFFLTPRTPKKTPRARHWYTVDEMIAMVRGPVAELIKMAGVLPDRPEALKPPRPGEKIIHIDATGPTVRTYYEMHKRSRYG
jgi:hypothetical protein